MDTHTAYKALMAAAAVAVIAFVGVQFYDRWQAHRAAEIARKIAWCDEAREMARLTAEGKPLPRKRSIESITATVNHCAREGL